MKMFGLYLLFSLSSTLATGDAIQCISCIAFKSDNEFALNAFKFVYNNSDMLNQQCQDDPTAVQTTINCPGSCVRANFTMKYGIPTLNTSNIEVQFFTRTCNPVKSLDTGCKDIQDGQAVMGLGIGFVNPNATVFGKQCVCNTDFCNTDTRNFPNLPEVPATKCPNCFQADFVSGDPELDRSLNAQPQHYPTYHPLCGEGPQLLSAVDCRGTCLVVRIAGQVNFTTERSKTVAYTAIQRQCSGFRTEEGCLAGPDIGRFAISEFIPRNLLGGIGVFFQGLNASVCTYSTAEQTTLGGTSGAMGGITWSLKSVTVPLVLFVIVTA
ncbi:uncharacterized protein LOC106176406 isoform X3 [Lingula anatina]|uniref:Uncharacterized protein LOC106176406 isoform X2 n=1 Tax=Lingula anatina TaxID=7574 RepID=A0A2R2MR47_LINAN|nr:uncharacterized protein LOC106176406 isoform X2 [Lingula anatina]XP_023932483.1 uncharacterized protein LOC106176406 isoform X3 [Lingula anatina]|eukprot:XP_023932482.1 uncharacterized protein LOC106176406 isoform X2 [Lingula anatina]